MGPTYYIGNPDEDNCSRDPLPSAPEKPRGVASRYYASKELAAAANVAISLGQPLLLTGEPGCGKTQFAEALADELNLNLHRFNTKSTSSARDLLYTYDALGHFRAIQLGSTGAMALSPGNEDSTSINRNATTSIDAAQFISLTGLGAAIVDSNPSRPFVDENQSPSRSVVLIDEIDKAPRDFPNDLLHEIDRRSFSVPELGNRTYGADNALAPIVIITSNSEKHLPDAFLRRCIYFNITFPDSHAELNRIVFAHLGERISKESALVASVLDYFKLVRKEGLERNPGLAELIQFIQALLMHGADPKTDLYQQHDSARYALGALLKNSSDLSRGEALLKKQ